MKVFIPLAAGLLSVGLAGALPASLLDKRAVSTDGTCGGANKYTCNGSTFGNCCSQWGWCGSSDGHCGANCNSAFGTCAGGKSAQPSATAQSSPSSKKPSPDASCGGTTGYTCVGSTFGQCCSANGWCGSTDAYCGQGCQTASGNCGSTTTSVPVAPSSTPTGGVMQCLNNKNVPYKMIQDAEYAQLAKPYNLRLSYNPTAIVLPTTNKHVQDAVVCASQAGVKVQAKSGGHSYASFSSGGKDGSMVIDLEPMQTINLNTNTKIATVGGGVRLGNLADGIWNQGKAALAHGTCPGVGIGGHFTHGGYGPVSRRWGLAMDQIVAADVVLANGTLIQQASSTNAPDIYWAIRGAADSFGIVTNFYLQTHTAPTSITYFTFSFNTVRSNKQTWTNTFLHIQDVARNATIIDNRISYGIYLDNYGTYSLSGAFFGSVNEFQTRIQPELLRTLPSNTPTVQSLTWYEYLVKEAGASPLVQPKTGYDMHENFFAKSLTVPEKTPLTATTLNAMYDYLQTSNGIEYYIIINLYGGPGSAINSKDTNFAAYSDRSSLWVFQNWGYNANSIDFINGFNQAVINAQPGTSFGAYLNYVDPSYSAATAHQLYYGDALYSRLLALKKQVDPHNVFWNPHAIGS